MSRMVIPLSDDDAILSDPKQDTGTISPEVNGQTPNSCQLPVSIPYTTFTRREKRLLTLLLGLATITSPLTATIYFPLLPLLREHFHTSAQAINLTLTIYIIFQALSPWDGDRFIYSLYLFMWLGT
jgi:hypothetical protein